MRQESGNITLAVVLGIAGTIGALYQFKSVSHSIREVERQRVSSEGESQVLSNLNRYRGLLGSNGLNAFAIYPEPYLKADTQLAQFGTHLAFQSSFNIGTQTVQLTQAESRQITEPQLTRIMTGAMKPNDLCQDANCAKSKIKLISFNRDTSGTVPERILSANVEVKTEVIDPRTKKPVEKTMIAQVPMEAPQVSTAILRLSEAPKGVAGKQLAAVNLSSKSQTVKVGSPELSAELIVGGVAVSAEISILEQNKTYSSDDKDQWGLDEEGFPKHGAVSIRNQGSRLVHTPVFTVEHGIQYTIVGRIISVDSSASNPELRLILDVALPPPPDPATCKKECADKARWYDGPYKGSTPGSYATMVPGKYSCMYNDGIPGGDPVYSFDPAKNCEKEGPIGFRTPETGCFVGNTPIRMADGRYRPISEIVVGDMLWNPILKRGFAVKKVIVGPETGQLLRISYAGRRELLVTPDHPFLDRFGSVVEARNLSSIVTNEGLNSPLSLEWDLNTEAQAVFNLEMDAPSSDRDAHFIDANGTIAGDHSLQSQIKSRNVEAFTPDAERWSTLDLDFTRLEL